MTTWYPRPSGRRALLRRGRARADRTRRAAARGRLRHVRPHRLPLGARQAIDLHLSPRQAATDDSSAAARQHRALSPRQNLCSGLVRTYGEHLATIVRPRPQRGGAAAARARDGRGRTARLVVVVGDAARSRCAPLLLCCVVLCCDVSCCVVLCCWGLSRHTPRAAVWVVSFWRGRRRAARKVQRRARPWGAVRRRHAPPAARRPRGRRSERLRMTPHVAASRMGRLLPSPLEETSRGLALVLEVPSGAAPPRQRQLQQQQPPPQQRHPARQQHQHEPQRLQLWLCYHGQ